MKLKVLVVDDFEMMRFMITKALREVGVTEIEEAEHGKQAIDKLADAESNNSPFQLVFCDWNMPEATGMEVLQFCRVMPAYQKTPFVMVTAEAESQNVVQAIKAGANDYIVKPVTPEDLVAKINRIFGKFKLQAA